MTKYSKLTESLKEEKPTKFIYRLSVDSQQINSPELYLLNLAKNQMSLKPSDYDNVVHLGFSSTYGNDMFMVWDNHHADYKTIFLGIVGDEFGT